MDEREYPYSERVRACIAAWSKVPRRIREDLIAGRIREHEVQVYLLAPMLARDWKYTSTSIGEVCEHEDDTVVFSTQPIDHRTTIVVGTIRNVCVTVARAAKNLD